MSKHNDEWFRNLRDGGERVGSDRHELIEFLGKVHAEAHAKGWSQTDWDAFQQRAIQGDVLEVVAAEFGIAPTAWDRDESEPCERLTPGCSVLHGAVKAETNCATW